MADSRLSVCCSIRRDKAPSPPADTPTRSDSRHYWTKPVKHRAGPGPGFEALLRPQSRGRRPAPPEMPPPVPTGRPGRGRSPPVEAISRGRLPPVPRTAALEQRWHPHPPRVREGVPGRGSPAVAAPGQTLRAWAAALDRRAPGFVVTSDGGQRAPARHGQTHTGWPAFGWSAPPPRLRAGTREAGGQPRVLYSNDRRDGAAAGPPHRLLPMGRLEGHVLVGPPPPRVIVGEGWRATAVPSGSARRISCGGFTPASDVSDSAPRAPRNVRLSSAPFLRRDGAPAGYERHRRGRWGSGREPPWWRAVAWRLAGPHLDMAFITTTLHEEEPPTLLIPARRPLDGRPVGGRWENGRLPRTPPFREETPR